jgi:two-component system chemotaxis response regulator CheY
MRLIVGKVVKANGFETIEAANGQEALLRLRESGDVPVDLALVDWNMPVMDGLTFIKRCRATPEYRDMALMMVTSESEQAQIVRALAAGAHEYMLKPFSEQCIAEKLELLGLSP